MTSFNDFGLSNALNTSLRKMDYKDPTPIQQPGPLGGRFMAQLEYALVEKAPGLEKGIRTGQGEGEKEKEEGGRKPQQHGFPGPLGKVVNQERHA